MISKHVMKDLRSLEFLIAKISFWLIYQRQAEVPLRNLKFSLYVFIKVPTNIAIMWLLWPTCRTASPSNSRALCPWSDRSTVFPLRQWKLKVNVSESYLHYEGLFICRGMYWKLLMVFKFYHSTHCNITRSIVHDCCIWYCYNFSNNICKDILLL